VEFRFVPVVRWLMEPQLRRRLERDVRDEVCRDKQYLEQRQRA